MSLPTDPPAVFVFDGRLDFGTSSGGLSEHRVRIVNYEKHSAGRAADGPRDQAIRARL